MVDLIGQQLGNYRLLRLLGRGGFADVYLGEQAYIKSSAACKVVRTPFTEEQSTAFLQEARILVRLRHPHIVRALDFAVEAGIAYLVLEYAPGGTLRTLCPKGARLPLDTILRVVRQVTSALQYAHDQGFIHRDVKPENLLLGPQGEVLLSDFGLAVFAPYAHHYSTQASVASGAGTSPYLAPEQLQGQPQPASDQYALGAVIYEWLTGTPPFQGSPIQIAMQPDFLLTAANARTIAEICVRLDGLPLAIELAAARIRLLSPRALLARLTQGLSVLTRGAATLPARQQTLRSTLQWSYDLLDTHEQCLFRHLSIFVGSFTLEAAEEVCGALRQDDRGAAGSVLDGVDSLLEKSLLHRVERQTGAPRLAMLETIREYGLECLTASGELESTRQAHATYYQALVGEVGPHLRSPERGKALDQLEQELDNLRAALNGLLAEGEVEQAVHLGTDLFWFWLLRGSQHEGQMSLERGLAAQGNVAHTVRAWALQALGMFVSNQGNFTYAVELWQTSLELFQKTGDTQGRAWALCNLGVAIMSMREYIRARQLLEESLALFRDLGDQAPEGRGFIPAGGVAGGVAHALHRLAWIANIQGEYASARALAEESLTLFRMMGDGFGISSATEILAEAALNQEDYAGVEAFLAEKLAIDRKDGV